MNHRVEIVALGDRSTPICSCGTLTHREFFGDRRTANAKTHIFRHLEFVFHTSQNLDNEDEYQIKMSDSMNCPLCSEHLDLSKDDAGLLAETDPSIVSCNNGHDFSAYLKNNTLFLFFEGSNTHSPFSTSQ